VGIVDAQARLRALDTQRSFCVSAPAGSGKTELLIQRYLALLPRVEKPEQVLAITFTRKAAAEMRERVLDALLDAVDDKPCEGSHRQKTRELALAVQQHDANRQWNLLQNNSQLNIKTIDSFCGTLTRQMPVLSDFGGQAKVTDYAAELYAEAVQDLFQSLGSNSAIENDLTALMLHFDNDWSRLQELLVSMLGRREQWGAYLGVHHQAEEAEQYLFQTVENLLEEALASLAVKVAPYAQELLSLQNYAAGHLQAEVLAVFPGSSSADLGAWRHFRQLLLTADKAGKWRAQLTVKMGFPPGKGAAQEAKDRLKQVITALGEVDGLLEELASVASLPEIEANSDSWRLVLHLSRILPMLSAQLLLVFQRHGTVDHTQVALSALQALGSDEQPTELALRLDYQLQHLLLDEFQDTAINQYELVNKLTRGWGEHNQANPENPRSIMIVGDGMQSIYGFRNANVGLFLRARQEGFNGVELEHLRLLSNFRSERGIVDWVNEVFSEAFPAEDNIARSQVSHTRASAVKPLKLDPAVALHSFRGEGAIQQEVDFICAQVQRGIADPECRSIAILARTRGHLQGILAELKQMDLAFSAQDIDSLANSHVIVDLMSLCRVLINPADAVAWMAILRAPWCGLELNDLYSLRTAMGSGMSHWQALTNPQVIGSLSLPGQSRLAHLVNALGRARDNRDRLALRIWIEQLWVALGGPATVATAPALEDAECFFQLLEQAEIEGSGLNLQWLESRLQRLYVKAENPDSKVQVMTLHKAKGLEFDWVIIPSLQKMTRKDSRPLLNWDEHSSASGQRGFLLAANDHSDPGEPSLYNYLEVQRGKKELEETTRLLYVGTTRAVSHLILTASLKYNEEKEQYSSPPARSLLGRIWPLFRAQMIEHEPIADNMELSGTAVEPRYLWRIKQLNTPEPIDTTRMASSTAPSHNIPERAVNLLDRSVGTVVHLVMEDLANAAVVPKDLVDYHQQRWDERRWQFELRCLGVAGEDLERGLKAVAHSVTTVLQDEMGRWLLSSEHRQASSELALTCQTSAGKAGKLVVDRTFVDGTSGIRWVVDYKNSQPASGEPRVAFLEREEAQYTAQLAAYKDAVSSFGEEPVRCALYFTALGYLHTVESLSAQPTK